MTTAEYQREYRKRNPEYVKNDSKQRNIRKLKKKLHEIDSMTID